MFSTSFLHANYITATENSTKMIMISAVWRKRNRFLSSVVKNRRQLAQIRQKTDLSPR
jgi:hypothetical protein